MDDSAKPIAAIILLLMISIMLHVPLPLIGRKRIILSGTAFALYYNSATNLEPMAWLIEFAAANTASMVLFVTSIRKSFQVNNAAFTAYTILPFITCSIACYTGFTFHCNVQHILRTFAVKLNRKALRELQPVSLNLSRCIQTNYLIADICGCGSESPKKKSFKSHLVKFIFPFLVCKFLIRNLSASIPDPRLMFAIASDNLDFVRKSLETVNPNEAVCPQSALAFTLTNKNLTNKLEIVEVLLDHGADATRSEFIKDEMVYFPDLFSDVALNLQQMDRTQRGALNIPSSSLDHIPLNSLFKFSLAL